MRKISAKWVPKCLKADQKRQRCQSSEQIWEFFRRNRNDFLSPLVTMDETWLYHYDPEIKQQLLEWRHRGSPRPKKIPSTNPLENLSPGFFGIKTTSLSFITFQRTKLSTRSVIHLCWSNWRTFWRKNAAGISQRGSCSCTTMLRFTGHFQPRRNWPTCASNIMIARPVLRIWPRRTTACSLDWKKKLKFRHCSSDVEVISAAETWLDGRPSDFFLSGLQKLEQRAKKYIEC